MEELRNRLEDVVDAHGPWTAMSIKLSDDVCTREPAVDHRRMRILQVCSDVVGKPLAAVPGARAGLPRGPLRARVRAPRQRGRRHRRPPGERGQGRLRPRRDGPRASELPSGRRAQSLGREVRRLRHRLLLGLLYHLPAPDAWAPDPVDAQRLPRHRRQRYLRRLVEPGRRRARRRRVPRARLRRADATETQVQKAKKLWASLDNDWSFWFTEPSRLNLLARAGFSSAVRGPDAAGCPATCATGMTEVGPEAGRPSSPGSRRDPPPTARSRSTPREALIRAWTRPRLHRGRVFDEGQARAARKGSRTSSKPSLCERSRSCRPTRRRSSSATTPGASSAARRAGRPRGTGRAPRARSGCARRRPRRSRCAG